jgi:hypothetical protein
MDQVQLLPSQFEREVDYYEINIPITRDKDMHGGFRFLTSRLVVSHVETSRHDLPHLALVRVGDVIIAVNGERVANVEEFQQTTKGIRSFHLTLRRRLAKVELLKAIFKPGTLGVKISDATGQITHVEKGGQAYRAGVKAGMMIELVAGKTYSYSDFEQARQGDVDYEILFRAAQEATSRRYEKIPSGTSITSIGSLMTNSPTLIDSPTKPNARKGQSWSVSIARVTEDGTMQDRFRYVGHSLAWAEDGQALAVLKVNRGKTRKLQSISVRPLPESITYASYASFARMCPAFCDP